MLKSCQIKFCEASNQELRNELAYRVELLYRDFIWVLRAQGHLTQEKQKLVKHVKDYFRISDQKHRIECHIAAINRDLDLIACSVVGPNTDVSWYKEARAGGKSAIGTSKRGSIDIHSYLYKVTDAITEAAKKMSKTNTKEVTTFITLKSSEFKTVKTKHKDCVKRKVTEGTESTNKLGMHITIIVQDEKDEEVKEDDEVKEDEVKEDEVKEDEIKKDEIKKDEKVEGDEIKKDDEIKEDENNLTTVKTRCKVTRRSPRKKAKTKESPEPSKDNSGTDKVLMPPPPTSKPTSPQPPNDPKVPTSSSPVSIESSTSSSSPVKTLTPSRLVNVSSSSALPTSSTPKNTLPTKRSRPVNRTIKTLPPKSKSLTTLTPPVQPTLTATVSSPTLPSSTAKVTIPSQTPLTSKITPAQLPSMCKLSSTLPSTPNVSSTQLLSTIKVPSSVQPALNAKLPPAQPPSVKKVPSSTEPLPIPKEPSAVKPPSLNATFSTQRPSTAHISSSVQTKPSTKVPSTVQTPSTVKARPSTQSSLNANLLSSTQTKLISQVPSSVQLTSITNTPSSSQSSSVAKVPPSSLSNVNPPSQPILLRKVPSVQPPVAKLPSANQSSIGKVSPGQPTSIAKTTSSAQLVGSSANSTLPAIQVPQIASVTSSSVQPAPIRKVPTTTQPPSITRVSSTQSLSLASQQSSPLNSTSPSTPLVNKNALESSIQIPTVDLTLSPELTSNLSSTVVTSIPASSVPLSTATSVNLAIPVPNLLSSPERTTMTNVTQTVQVSNKPLMSTFEVPSSQPVGLSNTAVQPTPILSDAKGVQLLSLPDTLDLPPLVVVPPPEPVITVPHSSSFPEAVQASTFILPSGMSFQLKDGESETMNRKRKLADSGAAVVNSIHAPKTLAISQLSKLTPVMVNATTVNSQGQMKISAISRITNSTQSTLSTSLASSSQKVIIVTNSAARATLNMRPGNIPVTSVNLPVIQRGGPRPQILQASGSAGVTKLRPKLMQVQAKSQPRPNPVQIAASRPSIPPKPESITAVNSIPVAQMLPRPASPANILPKPQAGNMILVNPPQGPTQKITAQKIGNAQPGYRMVQRGPSTENLITKDESAGVSKPKVVVMQKNNNKSQAVKLGNSNSESVKKLISNKFVVIQNPKRGNKQPVKPPPPPIKETPKPVVSKKPPTPIAKSTGNNNVVVLDLSQGELNQDLSATIAEILQASGIITSSSSDSQVTFTHSNSTPSSSKLSESDLSFLIQGANTLSNQVMMETESSSTETTSNSAEVAVENTSSFASHSENAVAVQHSVIDIPTNMSLEEYSSQQDFRTT